MAEDAKECWSLSTLEELEQAVYISEQRFPTLNDGSRLKQFADFYMALGDETRLRIVGVLQVRDSCMCELVDALKIPASTMRHHLKILERGGPGSDTKRREIHRLLFAKSQNPRNTTIRRIKGGQTNDDSGAT